MADSLRVQMQHTGNSLAPKSLIAKILGQTCLQFREVPSRFRAVLYFTTLVVYAPQVLKCVALAVTAELLGG